MEQEISRKEYKRFLIRAAREAECGLPVHYPDIAEIDSLIEDPAFSEVKFRKDVLFYFSAAMVYGFFRDKKWHELHPGRENMSVANLMEYLMTPMEGCLELHVGIWSEKADEQEKLRQNIRSAAQKVVNKMMFGLRDVMDQEAFLECVEGLEKLYEE